MISSIFSCTYLPSVCLLFFWWSLFNSLAHLKNLFIFLLSFKSSLCFLNLKPLSDMLFANVFSHFEVVFFLHFCNNVLQKADVPNFNQVHLFLLWIISKKCCHKSQVVFHGFDRKDIWMWTFIYDTENILF